MVFFNSYGKFIFRSFGIVLWEILTCAVPYHNIDPSAVMWGMFIFIEFLIE
jgi:hypothetical protein